MFHCVLYQPQIPPNTGNIIRLCANSGINLHLIHPLGFSLEDKKMRRAGLDYHEWAKVAEYANLTTFIEQIQPVRIFACSTKGRINYNSPQYQAGDAFLFGPETTGLPSQILNSFPAPQIIKIPMLTNSRSLNLSNAAAIILYEAWRQIDFAQII